MTDYKIIFDGGSIGNPGRGYGSYAVLRNRDRKQRIERVSFGDNLTSNEAEYDTLAAALEDLQSMIRQAGDEPGKFTVAVYGDSQLVIFQLLGRWKARDERMRQRRDRVLALAGQFKSVTFTQHPRSESVKLLGH